MKAVKVLQERGRERGNFASCTSPFPFPLSVAVAARVGVADAVAVGASNLHK